MLLDTTVSRRTALKIGAAAAALPLVHIRTAGAAGKLSIGFWDHWVPGGNDAMRAMVNKWAAQSKVDVSMDFITTVGNKNLLTLAAESQAKTGHDMQTFPTWEIHNNAANLENLDDVVERLTRKYGAMDPVVDYLAKIDGAYRGMPTFEGSQNKPPCARIDTFKQYCGMDLPTLFPASGEMGPGYDQWNYDAFLATAQKCAAAGLPFGMPMGQFTDAVDWVGAAFRAFGADLVDAKGNVTVKTDAVRTCLEWFKKACAFFPADIYSWDDASNNRALISGKSALITNPPSAWAVAVKDNPAVGSQCWYTPPPTGVKGRFTPYLPYFWGIWTFAQNKSAAKDLIEWLMQREQVEPLVNAVHGYDLPPFASMTDFAVWQTEGPPKGVLGNYPIRPAHHAQASIAAYPAPPDIAVQIYNQATMTKMVSRIAQNNEPIEKTIAWAQNEIEGYVR